jgi:hypothetical protein
MEFHDSWLLGVQQRQDETGWILFRGSIFRSNGAVFEDEQESGWQNVRFELQGMRIEGEIVELNQYAIEGEFWLNGQNQNGVMLLPVNQSGEICFDLRLAPEFGPFKIHATHVRSSFEGEFQYEFRWSGDPE